MRNPDRRLCHDLDRWTERVQDDPEAGQADHSHSQKQADEMADTQHSAAQAVGCIRGHRSVPHAKSGPRGVQLAEEIDRERDGEQD